MSFPNAFIGNLAERDERFPLGTRGNDREECFLLFFLDSHSQLRTRTLLDKNFSSMFKS